MFPQPKCPVDKVLEWLFLFKCDQLSADNQSWKCIFGKRSDDDKRTMGSEIAIFSSNNRKTLLKDRIEADWYSKSM